jgi:DNA-binding NarL/FixJ family response regulator
MSRQAAQALRILVLEDDPGDAELIEHTLKGSYPTSDVLCVTGRAAFTRALQSFRPDVILSDHGVDAFSAEDALFLVQARSPEVPFLLVSGGFHHTVARCLKAGAADFISKSELPRLADSIQDALSVRVPLRTLTARQLEVFHLITAGSSTREIARKLGRSVKTVESHRAQVMKRLGVGDVASLVRFAVKTGIVSPG